MIRRLSKEKHFAALDQVTSHISATMKLGAGTDEDPFAKLKVLITGMISRLQDDASTEANQKELCPDLPCSTASSLRFSQNWMHC